jgi:hypothetical protein
LRLIRANDHINWLVIGWYSKSLWSLLLYIRK